MRERTVSFLPSAEAVVQCQSASYIQSMDFGMAEKGLAPTPTPRIEGQARQWPLRGGMFELKPETAAGQETEFARFLR